MNTAENISDLPQTPLRIMPRNFEAEGALLGAILANNTAFEKVTDFLKPEHFAEPANGRIYAAIAKLIDRGQIADSVQLGHYFDNDEALKEVGGGAYLADLQASTVSIINAGHYGRTIHDLYLRREIMALGEDVVNDACEVRVDRAAEKIIEELEMELFVLGETGIGSKEARLIRDVGTSAMLRAQAAHKNDGSMMGLSTGLIDLDSLLGGLRKSNLVILAARPGMGKTALATNIAFSVAVEKKSVAFFSLEMEAEELVIRILSEQAGVSSDRIQRGSLRNEDFAKVIAANRNLEELDFFIDDTPALTIPALRTKARRLARKNKRLDFIVVDYLQLMSGQSKENRTQEVSEITRGLKAIAKELGVPVLALSQLSRQVENREDKRPQLSDLRESGSIEQDADVVMFIYREEYYLKGKEPKKNNGSALDAKYEQDLMEYEALMSVCQDTAKVIIAKQRHGPTGDVTLRFDGETTKFSNYSPR